MEVRRSPLTEDSLELSGVLIDEDLPDLRGNCDSESENYECEEVQADELLYVKPLKSGGARFESELLQGMSSDCTDLFREISHQSKLSDQQMCPFRWGISKVL